MARFVAICATVRVADSAGRRGHPLATPVTYQPHAASAPPRLRRAASSRLKFEEAWAYSSGSIRGRRLLAQANVQVSVSSSRSSVNLNRHVASEAMASIQLLNLGLEFRPQLGHNVAQTQE
jgi:hypothetical protein